ncbi:DUF1963 domain-containing protein [Ottowia sp.]|uniref:DUF1963 domain-containing protein n=1 Tax=Ottowia sp. TaxID=1898956 RepID=UPI003A870892
MLALRCSDPANSAFRTALSEFSDDGLLQLTIAVQGVYDGGVPRGTFHYEDSKDPQNHKYLRIEGLEYGFEFFGDIGFDGEWVLGEGRFKEKYGQGDGFAVRFAIQLNPLDLHWPDYQFTQVQELSNAAVEHVRSVLLTGKKPNHLGEKVTQFGEDVFGQCARFTQLRSLDIHMGARLKNEPLLNISLDGIRPLTQLQRLAVSGLALKEVPADITSLPLTWLSVVDCDLQTLPEAVWQMPTLENLMLDQNALTQLPEAPHLPALKTLRISQNALATLPLAFARLPALKLITAEANPLQHLDPAWNSFDGLDIDMEDRRRLLDTRYQGPSPLVEWDDTVYAAEHDPPLRKQAQEVLNARVPDIYRPWLQSILLKTLAFYTDDTAAMPVGATRYGGRPDLPLDVPYPEFCEERICKYEFIAQINLAELADKQSFLPRSGTLFFFLSTFHDLYGSHPKHPAARVIYVKDSSTLVSGERFQFPASDFFEAPHDGVYKACAVRVATEITAPDLYSVSENQHLISQPWRDDPEFEKFTSQIGMEEPLWKTPRFAMQINPHVFTQHDSPQLQASYQKGGVPEDWMVLLNVASCGSFCWGDAGDLFFVIHKSDLTQGDFSNVFVGLESS